MWVQILLIAVATGLILVVARQKATAVSALKKAGLVLLAVAMIVTVIFPEVTTFLARVLGIGRGADLLLYALTAAFLVYAIGQYLRAQHNRAVLNSLARRIALDEAKARYKLD